jgi:hypothetical protein
MTLVHLQEPRRGVYRFRNRPLVLFSARADSVNVTTWLINIW